MQKHGVPVVEIESLFFSTPLVGSDPLHSKVEQRFRAIRMTERRRSVFVVFTWRQKGRSLPIRPVSARYMHRKEVEADEKDIPDLRD